MKRHFIILIISVIGSSLAHAKYNTALIVLDTTFIPGGTITVDSTWSKAASPYVISGDVVVDNGATLTVEPGVQVYFTPNRDDQASGLNVNNSELNIVNGKIMAVGLENDSIEFTSLSQSPTLDDWSGIYIFNQTTDSYNVFDYVKISNGGKVVGVDNQFLTIDNSRIFNCANEAVTFVSDRLPLPSIKNSIIENCGVGIDIVRGGIAENNKLLNCNIAIHYQDEWNSSSTSSRIAENYFSENFTTDLQIRASTEISFNNFSNDNPKAVIVTGSDNISMPNNYWGTIGTVEMEAGGNPKNISTIYDSFDDPLLGWNCLPRFSVILRVLF